MVGSDNRSAARRWDRESDSTGRPGGELMNARGPGFDESRLEWLKESHNFDRLQQLSDLVLSAVVD